MAIVRYDGSFEGLLSIVYASYYERFIPERITTEESSGLFDTVRRIETDEEKAVKVLDAFYQKVGHKAARTLYLGHLGACQEEQIACYHFVRLGFSHPEAIQNPTIHCVRTVEGIRRKVLSEAHRMLGFIRFQKVSGGFYYAPFEPTYPVLSLVAGHFTKRFGSQPFILHDTLRAQALIHNDKESRIVTVTAADLPEVSDDENHYQQLWRSFFDTVAIRSRENPALQKHFVPLKYRNWMTEFSP